MSNEGLKDKRPKVLKRKIVVRRTVVKSGE